MTAMMVVLAVGAVGCCAWGMGESIMQTNQVISNFWILVHEVEEVVREWWRRGVWAGRNRENKEEEGVEGRGNARLKSVRADEF